MRRAISFIGAGKVGTALGLYFKDKNFEIVGYLSRNESSSIMAASLTGSRSYTIQEDLINKSNIVWITTPDDQIEGVAKQIASLNINNKEEKLFIHASGVHTTDVLNDLRSAGLHVAAAHPLLAFSNPIDSAEALKKGSWFAVEEYEIKISKLLNLCGNLTFSIDKDKKALYHAAACVMSNYAVTLANVAQRMFTKAGLPEMSVPSATMPLVESVIHNLMDKKPTEALTGPIKRGDAATVKLHIDTISKLMPEVLEFYKYMGKETMTMINDYKIKEILE